jgi:hypothetical protein
MMAPMFKSETLRLQISVRFLKKEIVQKAGNVQGNRLGRRLEMRLSKCIHLNFDLYYPSSFRPFI